MEDLTGRQFGPYRITGALGEGGMAAVYKAYQPSMDRNVALKVLPRHFASEPQFVARFRREARILAKLQHPHILPVHDFGEAEGYAYIVMPFVPSGTLAGGLTGKALPLARIGQIVSEVGGALEYAHTHGLIHRDIKPSNVLLDESGNCLLSDFGLAKLLEGVSTLTASGAIMGTPAYMSPEQGLGGKIDHRTDLYSLGVVIYEMATGRVPFEADTPMAVVIKHIHDPLPLPRQVNPALPESVEQVILKCLAKSPADRFQTAAELADQFAQAVAGEPPVERKPQGVKPARAGSHRETRVERPIRRLALLAGGVGALAIIGVLAANQLGSPAPEARPDQGTALLAEPSPPASADSAEPAAPLSAAAPTLTLPPAAEVLPATELPQSAGDTPIRIIDSFPIAADTLVGMTWDGESLWFSDLGLNQVLQTDRDGVPIATFPTDGVPLGLGWDGEDFWIFELLSFQFPDELLSRVRFDAGEINRVASFVLTAPGLEDLGGVIDMEWDGAGMWICDPNQRRVFRLDLAGTVLDSFVYQDQVWGIAWDGEFLWLSAENEDQTGQYLTMADPEVEGALLMTFPSPIPRMEALAWVEGELWALGENDTDGGETVYRLDVSGARNSLP